jgi:hypothetical protein
MIVAWYLARFRGWRTARAGRRRPEQRVGVPHEPRPPAPPPASSPQRRPGPAGDGTAGVSPPWAVVVS